MSDTTASLSRQIKSAGDLHSVVRTMKAIAASQIAQYENSVRALGDYHHSVELALSAWFRHGLADRQDNATGSVVPTAKSSPSIASIVVFGSDQGLVGQFNLVLAEFVTKTLSALPGTHEVWAIGERIHECLTAANLPMCGQYDVPTSAKAIVPLVGRIQVESGMQQSDHGDASLLVFYNRPLPGGLYEPVSQQLLPLDADWQAARKKVVWPTQTLPEVMPANNRTLRALIGEYLFISIFKACAESLASENASRLAAMTRATRNIDDLTETLLAAFHRLRQNAIDEELFDVIAGYKAHPQAGQSA